MNSRRGQNRRGGINQIYRSINRNILGYELDRLLRMDNEAVSSYLQRNVETFIQHLQNNLSVIDIVKTVYLLSKFARCQSNKEIKSSIFTRILHNFAWKLSVFVINIPLVINNESPEFQNHAEAFWISMFEIFEEIVELNDASHKKYMQKIFRSCKNFIGDKENLQAYQFPKIPDYFVDSVSHYLNFNDRIQIHKIYPSFEEISNWNENSHDLVNTKDFKNSEDYIKTQYILLRHQFMSTLSNAIKMLQRDIQFGTDQDNIDFRVFSNCKFKIFSPYGKSTVHIGKCQQTHFQDDEFVNGTLLCFSVDNYKTFFFGYIVTAPTDLTTMNVHLFEYVPFLLEKEFFVAEYKKDFYRASESILASLQNSFYTNLPMEEYVLFGRNNIQPPEYLNETSKYLLNGYEFKPLHSEKWPSKEALQLNEEQYSAFRQALTSKLTILEGAPGTGKTRIVLKVIETLLNNESAWHTKSGPILLLAFTNKSLDSFLEKVLSLTDSIIRIGTQSKSEVLKQYAFQAPRPPSFKFELTKRMQQVFSTIRNILKEVEAILCYSGLVSANKLQISEYLQYNVSDEEIFTKLMRGSSVENEKKERVEQINELEDIDDELIIVKDSNAGIYSIKVSDLECRGLYSDANYLKWRLSHKNAHREFYPREDQDITDIENMSANDLWGLYFYLVDNYVDRLMIKVRLLDEQQRFLSTEYYEQLGMINAASLKNKKVVGLTLSGAAGRKVFLDNLDSPIMIVEEASEVEHYHILGTIPKTCKHLILIGNGKPLPSKPNCTSLIDIILTQGYPSQTLKRQYRMKSEISYFLKSIFYPQIEDDESVQRIPDVRGISKNIFFIDHTFENDNAEQINWKRSINLYEVKFLLNLAKYLISQGHAPESITILTTTKYQAMEFDKLKENEEVLKEINSWSIDKFQSCQNDIILLSLVGINEHYQGFLSIENRICVGLSRAKQGLYIMGNIEKLTKQYEIWTLIQKILEEQKCIGKALPLCCNAHKEACVLVEQPEDFTNVDSQFLSCKLATLL